jgi:hypothetical protein
LELILPESPAGELTYQTRNIEVSDVSAEFVSDLAKDASPASEIKETPSGMFLDQN